MLLYLNICFFFLISSLSWRLMFFFRVRFGVSVWLCKYQITVYFKYMLCIPAMKIKIIPIFSVDVYFKQCVCVCVMKLCACLFLDVFSFSSVIHTHTYARTQTKRNTNLFSLLQRLEYRTPMSFEQALAMGRTGILPSPVRNGYKPKGLSGGLPSGRHSDSDEEDWC